VPNWTSAKLDKCLTGEYESGSLERKRPNDDGNVPRGASWRSGSGYCGWQRAADPIVGKGGIWQDGRAMRDTFLFETKDAAESTYTRDYDR
jgi:hypothetical protein